MPARWIWQRRIRYEWWGGMIGQFFGHYCSWNWHRHNMPADAWNELRDDLIQTYCAGGEL